MKYLLKMVIIVFIDSNENVHTRFVVRNLVVLISGVASVTSSGGGHGLNQKFGEGG